MTKQRKPLAGIFDDFKARYDAAVLEYRNAATALVSAENELWSVADQASKNPEDAQEWQTQMNKIIAMQSTMASVESALGSIADFFSTARNWLGLSGVKNKLGFALPAIPWSTLAVITGGAAAIWLVADGVVSFVNAMRRKAIDDENIRRSGEGLPPLEYPQDLKINKSGVTETIEAGKDLVKWITIGAIFFLISDVAKKKL